MDYCCGIESQGEAHAVKLDGGRPEDFAACGAAFERVRLQAKVRRITLHEARHTAACLMEKAGVPDSIRAAWCGHSIQVNRATYVHALPSDMAVARDALNSIYKIS
jgi:integrase